MDDLRRAFDPEVFRQDAHRTVDLLADYLTAALAGSMPVLSPSDPAQMLRKWPIDPVVSGTASLSEILSRVLAGSNHLHHPHYVGHQVTAPLPLAAVGEMVAAVLNNGMAVYEMGPVATAMERNLVRWMADSFRLGRDADGVFTSGGSVGNLTALLAARQVKAGFDIWTDGAHAGAPLAVLTSEQTHYSVQRAVQIMGWGRAGVVGVATDDCYRMRADALSDAHSQAQRSGRRVVAVVANACSTATGSYDPLEAIAEFCASRGLWLHVDGAHGASAILTPKYAHLLAGVEHADSIVWDAHKMLLMPALTTAVLFRRGSQSYAAFAQDASYLFAGTDPSAQWHDGAVRTLECTKRMMSLKLYLALVLHGPQLFAEYVTRTYDLARAFARMLRDEPDFEVALEPEANIVCFRHRRPHVVDLDGLQRGIRERMLGDGAFYLVQTRLRNGLFLRTTFMNPFTSEDDLTALIAAVRRAGAEVG